MSLPGTLLQTQKELAEASQQLERLRQDMKVQQVKGAGMEEWLVKEKV